MAKMTLGTVKKIVKEFAVRTPKLTMMLYSPPGIGKSAIIQQACVELGIGFKEQMAYAVTPTEVFGLPYVPQGSDTMRYAPSEMFPKIDVDGPRGVFFVDELTAATELTQNAWGNLMRARRAYTYNFPEGWMFVTAGNRAEHAAGASQVTTMLQNRVIEADVEVSTPEWIEYGQEMGFNPLVLTFIEKNSMMLLQFDAVAQKRKRMPFPSPRSWEAVSQMLNQYSDSAAIPEYVLMDLVGGTVGTEATAAFQQYFAQAGKLPDLREVLEGKFDLRKLKKSPDLWLYLSNALIAYAVNSQTPEEYTERINAVLNVLQNPDFLAEWKVRTARRLYDLKQSRFGPQGLLALTQGMRARGGAQAFGIQGTDAIQATKPAKGGAK